MSVPGWMDQNLIDAMNEADKDVGQHNQWWKGMNNGMSKCWLMQDGQDIKNTRYSNVDGAPYSFVYECKESSLPQEALDATFLFSPHSMLNLRGAVVPTRDLVPRIESGDRKWKIVGIWKKRAISSSEKRNVSIARGTDNEAENNEESFRNRLRNANSFSSSNNNNKGIHDMDLDAGMPPLEGSAEGMFCVCVYVRVCIHQNNPTIHRNGS